MNYVANKAYVRRNKDGAIVYAVIEVAIAEGDGPFGTGPGFTRTLVPVARIPDGATWNERRPSEGWVNTSDASTDGIKPSLTIDYDTTPDSR